MGFHKILVALDRSPQAPLVFHRALEHAETFHSELLLVHTVRVNQDVPTAPFLGMGTIADVDTYSTLKRVQQERMQKEIHQATDWLETYRQQAVEREVPVQMDCRSGEPSVGVCELAQSWNANLIVIGRRGHQGIKEVVLGSVSNYVIHHAPCSVLVVQGISEGG